MSWIGTTALRDSVLANRETECVTLARGDRPSTDRGQSVTLSVQLECCLRRCPRALRDRKHLLVLWSGAKRLASHAAVTHEAGVNLAEQKLIALDEIARRHQASPLICRARKLPRLTSCPGSPSGKVRSRISSASSRTARTSDSLRDQSRSAEISHCG